MFGAYRPQVGAVQPADPPPVGDEEQLLHFGQQPAHLLDGLPHVEAVRKHQQPFPLPGQTGQGRPLAVERRIDPIGLGPQHVIPVRAVEAPGVGPFGAQQVVEHRPTAVADIDDHAGRGAVFPVEGFAEVLQIEVFVHHQVPHMLGIDLHARRVRRHIIEQAVDDLTAPGGTFGVGVDDQHVLPLGAGSRRRAAHGNGGGQRIAASGGFRFRRGLSLSDSLRRRDKTLPHGGRRAERLGCGAARTGERNDDRQQTEAAGCEQGEKRIFHRSRVGAVSFPQDGMETKVGKFFYSACGLRRQSPVLLRRGCSGASW